MPPAVGIIAGAALAGGVAAASGAVILGLTGFALGAAVFGINIALGFVTSLLAPKPPTFDPGTAFESIAGRVQQVRQPITARRVIYGEERASGPLLYATTTSDNKFMHLIIALAGHECEAIGDVLLNDTVIHSADLDGNGLVTTGTYANKVRIKKHLGTTGQTADADLVSEVAEWTTNHRLREIAYLYVRLEFDQDIFPTNIPAISAWVKGKKFFDTRDSGTRWSPNPALCLRDFLIDSRFGLSAATSEIDDTFVTSAANICEEMVATVALAVTVASVSAANDTLDFTGTEPLEIQTGDRVQVTTTGTLPAGIVAVTDYFVIVTQRRAAGQIKLATTYANAIAGTQINITSAGSGTHTVTKNAEPRYTANGFFSSEQTPAQTISDLLSAMAGRAAHSGSTWRIRAGAFSAPTLTFDEGDMRGPLTVQTRHPRRTRFNAVRGVYASPINSGIPTDYPVITNSTYQTADNGERLWFDLDLPYTSRPHTAQRLAKIELERHRQEISVAYPVNLTGLQLEVGDTVNIDNDRMGWSGKPFESVSWGLVVEDDDGAPLLGVDLGLRETASAVYDWNSGEETQVDPAPNTNLPDPFTVAPPTSLTLTSGTAALFLKKDGTVLSRVKATWTAPADRFVIAGGKIEVQFKKTADSDWLAAGLFAGDVIETFIFEVEDGTAYDVRARAINSIGVRSDVTDPWSATVTGHVVVGKTTAPANVTGFTIEAREFDALLSWDAVLEADLKDYEVRTGTVWEDGTFENRVAGTSLTITALAAGTNDFMIKAFDTTGNESASAASVAGVVISPGTPAISSVFNGSNFELSWVTSKGSFAIRDYEVRRGGSSFATASFVATTDGTIYISVVDWIGTEKWWVRATDIKDNTGSSSSIDLTIVAPSVANLSAQVIDNTVLLRWIGTIGSLPVKEYEVRKGAIFASASVIGVSNSTFVTIFETVSGVFTYWVRPVDTADNLGTETSVTATVDEPPDFVLSTQELSDWVGDLSESNLKLVIQDPLMWDADDTVLMWAFSSSTPMWAISAAAASINLTETIDDHFDVNNSFASPQAQIDAGFPFWIEPTLASASIEEEIDAGAVIASSRIIVDLNTDVLDGAPTTQVTISRKKLSGDPYVDFPAGDADVFATDFQFVKTKVDVTTANGNDLIRLNTLLTTIRSKLRNDAGKVTVSANPTTVNFNVAFIDIESIVVTPEGTVARISVVDFVDTPNPTSFDIHLFDSSGVAATGDVRWTARGF